jgi:hypothetical protein
VLDEDAIRAHLRLFLTATPRRFTLSQKEAAAEQGLEVASMDDTSLFGPELHRLTFGEAIERGLLADYRVVVAIVADSGQRRKMNRRALVRMDDGGTTDAGTLASQALVLRAVRRWGLRRVLTFHHLKEGARAFAATLRDTAQLLEDEQRPPGTLWTTHIVAETPAVQRRALLRRLSALNECDWATVSSVETLSEGVDVPAVDAVAILDPKRSTNRIIQAVGRALRTGGQTGKIATIIVPVFLPEEGGMAAAIESSAFGPVLSVLQALREHDERLAEQFDALRLELGHRRRFSKLPDRIELDLYDAPEALDAGLLAQVRAHVVKQNAPSLVRLNTRPRPEEETDERRDEVLHEWAMIDAGLNALSSFVAHHAHARPTRGATWDGFPLGGWVAAAFHAIEHRHGGEPGGLFNYQFDDFVRLVTAFDVPPAYPKLARTLDPLGSVSKLRKALQIESPYDWLEEPERPRVLPRRLTRLGVLDVDALRTTDLEKVYEVYMSQYADLPFDERYAVALRAIAIAVEAAEEIARRAPSAGGFYAAGFVSAIREATRLWPLPDELSAADEPFYAGIEHGKQYRRTPGGTSGARVRGAVGAR